jgi:parallel beta-helix repeat protein
MKKELIGIFVFILLVGAAIPVTGTEIDEILLPPPKGVTLYVGGSGEGNYTHIQDAINNSVDGYTVFVYSKTYIEKIEIDVSIDLIGKDKDTTIISGNNNDYDNVINVATSHVKICGFTVKSEGSNVGIHIEKHGYNTIIDNIVKDCNRGISIFKSSYNNIVSNLVSNNTFGIYIIHSSFNTIMKNNVTKNGDKGIK